MIEKSAENQSEKISKPVIPEPPKQEIKMEQPAQQQSVCSEDASKEPEQRQNQKINTLRNENYHGNLLTLFKIKNNTVMNNIYYKMVPEINKTELYKLDLYSDQAVFQVNLFIK